jgi:hypothetical protein
LVQALQAEGFISPVVGWDEFDVIDPETEKECRPHGIPEWYKDYLEELFDISEEKRGRRSLGVVTFGEALAFLKKRE